MKTCCLPVVAALLLSRLAGFAGDWPQWRGPERTGHASPGARLPASLPKALNTLWRLDIGGGFSSPVIAGGKLLYLDAQDGKEVAHLVDANTGREFWRVPFAEMFADEWGPGPRCTPLMDGERAYVQSCDGEFRCLNLADGATVWRTNFEKDFGVTFVGNKANEGTASRRGNSGSGVIDGGRLYVPVGSKSGASVVCFDKRSGKILWKSQDDEAAYAGLMVATIAGVRQVVFFSADALMGLAAEDGALLWRVPLRTGAKRHASTPIIRGNSVTVNSHTIGLVCFNIERDGASLKATEAWANRNLKINIATPVLARDFLFSQGAGRNLVCVEAQTGKQTWSQEGFGERYSSIIAADGRLLIVTDRGELVLAEADGSRYREMGRLQVSGRTWSHPAFADGKLYVREGLTSGWKLTCFDLNDTGTE